MFVQCGMNCTLAPLLSPAHPEADAGERAALLLLAAVERLHGEPLQLVDRHVVGGFPCGLRTEANSSDVGCTQHD